MTEMWNYFLNKSCKKHRGPNLNFFGMFFYFSPSGGFTKKHVFLYMTIFQAHFIQNNNNMLFCCHAFKTDLSSLSVTLQ